MIGGCLGKRLHNHGLVPEGLQPNHGWRHRFKTVGLELGVSGHIERFYNPARRHWTIGYLSLNEFD